MIKEFKVTEEQDTLTVFVELQELCRKEKILKTFFKTSDVATELKKQGFEFGKLVTAPEMIQNWNSENISGTWVFEKKKLDKPAKPVTLKEEKSVQPKPTRKKRTRSSTTKVSTED